ncbi:MAG: single-stranded DNA-binding protein [Oscillospiraceae bacterium]|jgi:single-strand DNA-binding protein|nr:single-stranded DNA-binding protein [Oscillospiraceae bacterium]
MLNNVTLMGRLVAEPELRHTPNDVPVVTFTLAVERDYVSSGHERQTDFIDIVAWRKTAEFVSKYFHKGQLVAVNGSIQTRSYEAKDGSKRKAFEIVADNVYFAEAKRNSDSGVATQYGEPPPIAEPSSFSSGSDEAFEEIITDDDLPF